MSSTDHGTGWIFSPMPSMPPKPTTANMMAFSVLARFRSSILPMTFPPLSLTSVPITRDARIAVVSPDAVGIFCLLEDGYARITGGLHEGSRWRNVSEIRAWRGVHDHSRAGAQ